MHEAPACHVKKFLTLTLTALPSICTLVQLVVSSFSMPVTTRGGAGDEPTTDDDEAKSPEGPAQRESADGTRDVTPNHMAAAHALAKMARRQKPESDEDPAHSRRVMAARARAAAAAIEAGGGKRISKRKWNREVQLR